MTRSELDMIISEIQALEHKNFNDYEKRYKIAKEAKNWQEAQCIVCKQTSIQNFAFEIEDMLEGFKRRLI